MSVGRLSIGVILDNPHRPIVGSEDLISGKVLVTCRPGTSRAVGEIFGPLKLQVLLHGRAKTKIVKSTGNSRATYRGRAPLFRTVAVVHNASFKGEVGGRYEFPFAIGFPNSTQLGGNLFDSGSNYAFHSTAGKPLPPTMFLDYRGFAHHFDCFVEYKLAVSAVMPGIDVQVSTADETTIRYQQPGAKRDTIIHRTLSANRTFSVSNAQLLSPTDRPSGFREKAKAMFSSDYFPKFSFEITHEAPQYLYVGEQPAFLIRVRHLLDASTAPVTPDITLESFSISLKALTEVRAERQILFEQTSRGDETVYTGSHGRFGPFEKSRDWTWQIRGKALPPGFTPSFTTYNTNRRYEMKIKWVVACTEKQFSIERNYSVSVNPAPTDGSIETAGSSSAPMEDFSGMEQALQDGRAGPGEALPSYQEAAGDAAPPPIQSMSRRSSDDITPWPSNDPPPFSKEGTASANPTIE